MNLHTWSVWSLLLSQLSQNTYRVIKSFNFLTQPKYTRTKGGSKGTPMNQSNGELIINEGNTCLLRTHESTVSTIDKWGRPVIHTKTIACLLLLSLNPQRLSIINLTNNRRLVTDISLTAFLVLHCNRPVMAPTMCQPSTICCHN